MNSAPATNTDAAWLCGLLQTGDSFYPTGSYAHSFGLEGLVQAGVVHDLDTLRRFLVLAALPALQHADLPIAAHAWRDLDAPDWPAVGRLCVLSSALKTAREARAASENIGRQRAELAARLHASPLAAEFLRRAGAAGWPVAAPVAAALEGRVLGAPLAAVLAGVSYSALAALIAAAMKLLRLGQNGAQALLRETLATAPGLFTAAAATPLGQIGWFNPWLDIAAARHESAGSRMFIS
jgi:urease accessory protein